MHAPIRLERTLRPAAETAFRTVLAVVGAMLLILVVLPAILAVQAASI
jgi:DNA-binding phage protein